MNAPFFPEPVFGWLFYSTLVALLVIASCTDLRWMLIPKPITITASILGILFNVVRGGWLGSQESVVWLLPGDNAALGAVDGLLFASAGFVFGFALFFGMWILGIVRGGDAKLFAAVSAWVGPYHAIWLLGGSTVIMMILAVGRFAFSTATRGYDRSIQTYSKKRQKNAEAAQRRPHRLMTYSLPLGVATAVLMLWFYRYDLQLMPPRPADAATQHVGVNAHDN